MDFLQELNNRELATIIWITVVVILLQFHSEIRKSFFSLIRAFFAKKLAIIYTFMLSYIALMLLLLNMLGIWGARNTTITLLWIICVTFVMLFEFSKENDVGFFKSAIKDYIKLLVLLEFIINLYVFSLWLELLLVPFSALLGGMIAIAETNLKYKKVQKILNYILAIIGLAFTVYAVLIIISDFNEFATLVNFWNFVIPILLTILFLPFIYFVALYACYESLFIRLQFFIKDNSILKYAKKKTLIAFRLNLGLLNRWAKHINTLRIRDNREVDEAIKVFKEAN